MKTLLKCFATRRKWEHVHRDICTQANTRPCRGAKTPAQKSVTWSSVPDITVTSAEGLPRKESVPIEVSNICKIIAEVQPPILQLSSDNRLFWRMEPPDYCSQPVQSGECTKSLEVFLEEQRQMDPEDRIKLAMNLASSILQYNLTPWLQGCWTNRSVHFFIQTRNVLGIDIDHPLIIKNFIGQTSDIPKEPLENDPELALMELGILLLEVWNTRTFESWLKTAGHSMDIP